MCCHRQAAADLTLSAISGAGSFLIAGHQIQRLPQPSVQDFPSDLTFAISPSLLRITMGLVWELC
jgi:hypothetical protein